jgi:hypothetical protein
MVACDLEEGICPIAADAWSARDKLNLADPIERRPIELAADHGEYRCQRVR